MPNFVGTLYIVSALNRDETHRFAAEQLETGNGKLPTSCSSKVCSSTPLLRRRNITREKMTLFMGFHRDKHQFRRIITIDGLQGLEAGNW